ncbi:hypothetical protein ciss_14790 [Carboxydothermus islandicus]|uniref:Uncharacterized protein n=1 Tax=Carboxydothermus islandicus TaxID=661089 RepID=A0A1L8D2W8_9THEO|nr:cytochrome c3 family protein [Carboxydothermus islandicus]GAV25546.1 hypothetical protein ciss_14790 [Carboxydothermus islandicus]
MRRTLLILMLVALFLLASTASALAAQLLAGATGSDSKGHYAPTVKKFLYEGSDANKTYYPNEIYLPNETNPANYRIHSNYSRNTDACAACHATHTAVGQTLLQWGSVYDTCMACHDGTIGTTYNVEEGYIGTTGKPTFGGMFGTGSEGSLSNHNVTGAVNVFAAPGGNITGNYEGNSTEDKTNVKAWDITFGCESCHSPHGLAGNARILNPNVNNYSFVNYKSSMNVVYDENNHYWYTRDAQNNKYQWLRSYPYNKGTQVWYNNKKLVEGKDYELNGTQGFTYIVSLNSADFPANADTSQIKVYFYPALKVTMSIENYLGITGDEKVQHKSGINSFCGACHTDYNTENFDADGDGEPNGSSDNLNGQYTEAYRHQVGFKIDEFEQYLPLTNMVYEEQSSTRKIMTCLTCHVAHGTSENYWSRTLTNSYWSGQSLTEIAGSSALKRAPNMGTCETCHRKGFAAEGYNSNTAQNVGVNPGTGDGLFTSTTAQYVGAAKCFDCHPSQSAAMKKALPGTADYQPLEVEVRYDGSTFTVTYDPVKYAKWKEQILHPKKIMPVNAIYLGTNRWVVYNILPEAIEKWEQSTMYSSGTNGLNKFPWDFKYAMGSKWKQRYVYSESGTLKVVTGPKTQFNAGYRGIAQGWVKYDSDTLGSKNFSSSCIGCHTTGWNGEFDAQAQFADPGVTCEACHGPGSNHVKAPSQDNIKNPARLTIRQQNDLCGSCHGRGKSYGFTDARYNGKDYIYGYKPGVSLMVYYKMFGYEGNLSLTYYYGSVSSGTYYYKRGTNERWDIQTGGSSNFWADNTSSGHHQQYIDFYQTKMFDTVSCITCHSSHSKPNANNMLKLSAGATCAQCHDSALDLAKYMPYTAKSAGNYDIRSHAFRASFSYPYSITNNVPGLR